VIVVDTNVIAYLFLRGTNTAEAEDVFKKDPEWAAPYLWRSEFRNILATYLRNGYLKLSDARSLISDAENLMSHREFEVDSAKILDLTNRSGCTAYDCEFIALAEELRTSFVTSDRKVLKSIPATAISMADFIVQGVR
jgi:predicted nucleic acid-binding protein